MMKVVIAGYGVEGESSYDYWVSRGDEVAIADERAEIEAPSGAKLITGPEAFLKLADFDLIIRSPGVSPSKLPYPGKVWSATNEFFKRAKDAKVLTIGVTGTKGKGTTCSLIASILRAAGKTVHLVGNIGTPALDVVDDMKDGDVVIYELSSFQLWDVERSPSVAVVLMIEPDHLDVHEDLDDYVAAKSNIVRFQKADDVVIYQPENQYSKQIALISAGKKQRYGTPEDGGVYINDNSFYDDQNAICSVNTLHIAGIHNQDNACAAITAVRAAVPEVTNQQIAEGLSSFRGLPHRLQLVREIRGVKFYDDSISTTPGSAIAALRSFDGLKLIILGGSDKGADYKELVATCKQTGATVLAVGETGAKIAELCRSYDVPVNELGIATMDEVVETAFEMLPNGGVVLLSPASASFDMYVNYKQRGDAFMAAVNAAGGA